MIIYNRNVIFYKIIPFYTKLDTFFIYLFCLGNEQLKLGQFTRAPMRTTKSTRDLCVD